MNKYDRPYKVKIVGGQPVKSAVSRTEVKQTIMKVNGWDEKTYRKQVDLFKNQLRAYESYTKARGVDVKPQSPVTILYAQAKAKKRKGADYRESSQLKLIKSFPAYSISKGREVAASNDSVAAERLNEMVANKVMDDYDVFWNYHEEQCELIYQKYGSNPVLFKEAMAAYAEAVKAARPKGRKVGPGGIAEYGESAGSPDSVEFGFEAFDAAHGLHFSEE